MLKYVRRNSRVIIWLCINGLMRMHIRVPFDRTAEYIRLSNDGRPLVNGVRIHRVEQI